MEEILYHQLYTLIVAIPYMTHDCDTVKQNVSTCAAVMSTAFPSLEYNLGFRVQFFTLVPYSTQDTTNPINHLKRKYEM